MIHRQRLIKPDGRALVLYAEHELPEGIEAPAPSGAVAPARPHLRWHPLRGEWVAYAGHRQERTYLPPPGYDPLAATVPGTEPTELPAGPWQVAVFENRFPSLVESAAAPEPSIVATRPGHGVCEVVVYTQQPSGGLGDLPLSHIELLISVWAERTSELGERDGIEYVLPFENRGLEVGATLQHPHGQIYAYPVIPPVPARELAEQRRHFDQTGRGLLEEIVENERRDGRRMLYEGEDVAAFVPAFARYPYEVWIAPKRARAWLGSLDARERADFARALKSVVLQYDGLFTRPFPYVMVFHQAPTDGEAHPEAHVHAEFYPPYRTREKLKYLAGTEIGAGFFTNDALPEQKAAELRQVPVRVEEPVQ